MKLALGTVQFGLHYGVSNRKGQVSGQDASDIIHAARSSGLDTIDTAIGYGNSEAVLGQIGMQGWRVVSKLPPLPHARGDTSSWVETQILGSLQRLGLQSLDAILLHHPADLLGKEGKAYRHALTKAKADGLISAAGVSIYAPQELDEICSVWMPDLVQAPSNVLDQRLITSGWLSRLQDGGVRVHIRSAFLQGLLLMPPEARPDWFSPWRDLLDNWHHWCMCEGISPLQGALSHALGLPGIERVVVGVDSLEQLREIVLAAGTQSPPLHSSFASSALELIEPSRWNLT